MKTKFTLKEIMHVFAQRSQSHGSAGNVFFENNGNKIYSYGYHYLLGEFIQNNKGETALMIKDSRYSVSTSKHISMLTSATRQYLQFFTSETNTKQVLESIENNVKRLQTAKKPELYIEPSKRLFATLNDFILWSGKKELTRTDDYKKVLDLMKVIDGNKDFYTTYLRKNADKLKREQAKAAKAEAQKLASDVKNFENFEINRIWDSNEDFVRYNPSKNVVQTSQEVEVNVKEAKMLYKMILANKNIKGVKIDNWTVISINGVLKIGCHNINIESMHKVGKQLLNL